MTISAAVWEGIDEHMLQFHVPGMGIAFFENGDPGIKAKYYGAAAADEPHPVTGDTLFHACSISKMATALGVLRLVQQGLLDLDEDVNRYLVTWRMPENLFTRKMKVTLRMLLSHQAGIVDPEGSFDICQPGEKVLMPADILSGGTRYNPEPVEARHQPMTQFVYSDAGYSVVEQLLEDVTGEAFAALMDRLVFAPMGLVRTFFWNGQAEVSPAMEKSLQKAAAGHDRSGKLVSGRRAHYPNLSGAGMWTTPEELALLVCAIVDAWNGEPETLLSQELARGMTRGWGCEETVGLGVFLDEPEAEPCFVSQGWGVGFQCKLVAYPRLRRGLVVMTNSDPGLTQNQALAGEVIRALGFAG